MSKIDQSLYLRSEILHAESLFSAMEGAPMPDAKAKLLIVDDDVRTRTLLLEIFTEFGHCVRSAEDGFSGLLEIRQEVPDLILSELYMEGMSGFEFLSVVRRRFPGIQVIAMSGSLTCDGLQHRVAADAFYEKGTDLSGLLQTVEVMSHPEWLPSFRPLRMLAPIWIPSNSSKTSGEAYVFITCPECQRTFPQAFDETICAIQEASCVYCRNLVSFTIVPPADRGIPRELKVMSTAQKQMELGLLDFN